MNLIKLCVVFAMLTLSNVTNAAEIIVTSASNGGVGSFREAVETLALPNDTIIINVKGTITLTAEINFTTDNLTIIGPYPKHNTFTSTTTGINMFSFNGATGVRIIGLGFKNVNVKCVFYINGFSSVSITSCLFENNTCSSEIINTAGNSIVRITNSTFYSNSSVVINMLSNIPPSKNIISNNTFNGNSSAGVGIILCNGSVTEFINNLFTENNSLGAEVINVYNSAMVELINNVFYSNGTGEQITGSFLNSEGNRIVLNGVEANPFSPGDDITLGDLKLSLQIEDGYGLKYFRIEPGSVLIDAGMVGGIVTATNDCRRAPRQIGGTIDIGPCEYTASRVTNTADNGPGSLATAVGTGGFIEFNLPLNSVIDLTSSNINIVNPNVYIDGYSQPGSSIAGPGLLSASGVTPASDLIEIKGDVDYAFSAQADNITIVGLNIYSFEIQGIFSFSSATNLKVYGNHIGFRQSGATFVIDENKSQGIVIQASNAMIGGNQHWQRNVISGNGQSGLSILKANINIAGGVSTGNNIEISGNIIGLKPDGISSFGLGVLAVDGISKISTSLGPINDLSIGNNNHLGRNVISGNQRNGIYLEEIGTGCRINNNYIGLGYDGVTDLGNLQDGIQLLNCSNPLGIGGSKGNFISGNTQNGINLQTSSDVIIVKNSIGLDITNSSVGNELNGIKVSSSSNIEIGNGLYGNTISGNTENGIILDGSLVSNIKNNRIGTDTSGTSIKANGQNGIHVIGSNDNGQIISNLISGNGQNGVLLEGTGSTTGFYQNYIGTDVTGSMALANGENGVKVTGTHGVSIGNAFPNHNLISGNQINGIQLFSESATVNGNIIGLNKDQNATLANAGDGVEINANNVSIGNTELNIISGNGIHGISVELGQSALSIENCIIGTNISGQLGLGNQMSGFYSNGGDNISINTNTVCGNVQNGLELNNTTNSTVTNNFIGLTSIGTIIANNNGILLNGISSNNQIGNVLLMAKNVISGNTNSGVLLSGADVSSNFIQGNYIGLDVMPASTDSKANKYGIEVSNGAHDNHIGADGDETKRNVISGNTTAGIYIHDTGTTNNKIFNNNLGTTSDYTNSLANDIAIWILNCNMINYIGLDNSTLNSPVIGGNSNGIVLDNSSNQIVYNCKIGTSPNGLAVQSNTYGIVLQNGSTNNSIGGVGLKGNLISGNITAGIAINSSNANKIIGNKIGTNLAGVAPISNGTGVIVNGGSGNLIGRPTLGEGNLISGNSAVGVSLENNPSNTLVQNNKFGTNNAGNSVFLGGANGTGVQVKNTITSNQIGGDITLNEGNVFADNNISVYIENSSNQLVYGNIIGIKADGSTYLGNNNANVGVYLKDGSDNLVGEVGNNRNSIANQAINVFVDNETDTEIKGNYIGNNLAGDGILSGGVSSGVGIQIDSSATGIRISENVLSGLNNGIEIKGVGTSNNSIQGNKIGTDVTGNLLLGNTNDGINISEGASSNSIGGTVTNVVERNIISGNTQSGIAIHDANSNFVFGNYIGATSNGTSTLSNQFGISVLNSVNGSIITGNRIGGLSSDSTNYIVGCLENGIGIGQNIGETYIVGNVIGQLPDGVTSAGMGNAGILVYSTATNIKIGGINTGESNKIINNTEHGVKMTNTVNTVSVLGNEIYNNILLGIDITDNTLAFNGPTDDNTSGVNNNIQMPIILEGFACAPTNTMQLGVVLRGLTIGQSYVIEFYNNSIISHVSGYGEGHVFITRATHTALTNTDTAFFDMGATILLPGSLISATMTNDNGNGSTSEFSQNNVVIAQPTAPNFTLTNVTCNGSNDGSIEVDDTGNSKIYYFGLDVDIPSFNPTYDTLFSVAPGTYNVTYKYLNGCEVTATGQTVLNGPIPTFTSIVVNDTCGAGGEIVMDASGNVTGNLIATPYENITSGLSQSTGGFTGLPAGDYEVVLHTDVGGANCVSDTVTIAVLIENLAANGVLDFTYNMCETSIGAVTVSPIYLGGTYSSVPAGIDSNTGIITSPSGTYDIIYTVGTCAVSQNITSAVPLDPDFSMSLNDSICFGEVYSVVGPNLNAFDFESVPADGAQIDVNGQISNYTPITYSIRHITAGSCADTLIKPLVVLDLPVKPNITTADSIICNAQAITVLITQPVTNVNWLNSSLGIPLIVNVNTYLPVFNDLQIGDNYYYAYVVDEYDCSSLYDSINLLNPSLTELLADDDVEICSGSEITLGATGAASYFWPTINDGSSEQYVTVEPLLTTNYAVVLKDVNGCEVFDTVKVTLKDRSECNIEIVTAFSPNDDGVNDTWIIKGIEAYQENKVFIFNRWGDMIGNIKNYDNEQQVWNGENFRTNSRVVPGTYFYVVEANSEKKLSGWVEVVR